MTGDCSCAQTDDVDLFDQLKVLIDRIPDNGLKCILAGVGLERTGRYKQMLDALAASGKMELVVFDSVEQINEAFDAAAETIIELTAGYHS